MFNIQVLQHQPLRPTEQVPMREVFGFGKEKNMVTRFTDSGPFVPPIDPNYKFPERETAFALLALEKRESCYLVGHSGTGKTELVHQIAARLNYNVVRINFDGHLLRSDLLGEYVFLGANQGQQWRYGKVPLAFMLPGTIILLDEIDACPPETTFVLQRALDESKTLDLHEVNQVIPCHPQNCIFGTANTKGQGDDSGLYNAGTHIQNFSFVARWKMTLVLDYMSEADEAAMLRKRFAPDKVTDETIKGVCQLLASVRSQFKRGTISQPLTTRDAINWIDKLCILQKIVNAAEIAFLNRMPERDAAACAELIYASFDVTEDDSQRFARRAKNKVV